jgi:hypothetical protein
MVRVNKVYRLGMDNDDARAQAIKRLQAKDNFRAYLLTWLGVSILLTGIWVFTAYNSGHLYYFWPAWAIGGMGIGAAAQAYALYGRPQITEDRIQREMDPRAS